MKEKIKCKKCHLSIDADSKICPYCGYNQEEPDIPKVEKKKKDKKENLELNLNRGSLTFHRAEGAFSLANLKHIAILFIQLFVMQLIVLIVNQILISCDMINKVGADATQALLTLISYPILLVLLLLSLWKDFIPVCKTFKYWKNILYGLGLGVGILTFTLLYNMFIEAVGGASSNDNQQVVEKAITLYPAGCVIVLGFIGPMCEEISYRLGLYGLIRKKNMWVALVVSSLIFGLIHFNFAVDTKEGLINELINLPSYIISGAILAFGYEIGGLGTSITAHVTNNLIATIVVLVQSL